MRLPRPALGLRLRLVVAFGLGALALSVVLAAVSFGITRSYLLQQRERASERQAQIHADAVEEALRTRGTQVGDLLSGLRNTADTQSLLHLNGRWYTSAVGIGPGEVPSRLAASVLSGMSEHQRVRLSGDPVLVVGIPIRGDSPVLRGRAAIGAEFDASYTELSFGSRLGLRVALFGAGLGFWTSRRLLKPLAKVAAASREIAGGRLDARIDTPSDRELAVLSVAFNGMAAALQERIQRERRFTADVSHELRSPLTVLSAAAGALESRRPELSERGRSALDLLSNEIRRFSLLVEDLLEISRMDAGMPIPLEPVQLAQIVLRAQMLAVVSTPVRIEVDSAALPALMLGDKRRLERIVANLLDNADRYASSSVELQLQLVETETGDRLRLTVDDDGPGVPAADQDRIFDRFARSAGAVRRGEGGGAGLGLALVRQHVHLHGGTISVERSPIGGARFLVDFPVQLADADHHSPDLSAPQVDSTLGRQSQVD